MAGFDSLVLQEQRHLKWRALDPLENLLMILCGVCITAFSVLVLGDVITRAIGRPWLWVQEATMTFFMYGFQNLRGVIEEKTNRIVEVIIASVRPTELMLGKIVGIGLVGLTQYLIWSLVAMNLSLPAIAGMMAAGASGAPTIPLSMIGYFLLFFILGYFLYASIYTAIGAPFTDQA